ncbi:MAG: S-adenosylmethionine:tRNA ribosyltransferase-isomerase [Acidobacteriia bacterium]|nr:S-adenosylmethionine:tRNA ribosyltransferase-isomerase [Terriglobia bacterium]
MIAASQATQRPGDAKLLVIDAAGEFRHAARASFAELLHAGDLVIANDAATLPASLGGIHVATGSPVEVRLAGRRSLSVEDVREFSAIVFGPGDFRTRTEDRPAPPVLGPGDRLALGPLSASIECLLGHPRLVRLRFEGSPDAIWSGLARHGRPIQYAHVPVALALWDIWTPIAGPPVAFEPPSAGFAIDWHLVAELHARRVGFATITHAAGISSTGDPALDARLPFDEPYRIPETTAARIRRTRSRGGRIVAIGTTVVRALEHAAREGVIHAGEGLATQRIGPATRLRAVDVILSGTHEPGTSHYELLRAFASDATLERATRELDSHGYRTHEFGDSVWIEKVGQAVPPASPACGRFSLTF